MKHRYLTRRELLAHAAGAGALGIAATFLPAGRYALAADAPEGSLANGFLTIDDPLLRELAFAALEAARSAGAQFADVRVNVQRILRVDVSLRGARPPFVREVAEVGVRAVVDGAWGFAGDYGLTPDNARSVARIAVERASAARTQPSKPMEIAPAPVVKNGRWITPIEIDPFTVSIRDHEELVMDSISAATKPKSARARLRNASSSMHWMKSDRVFASTEGSFIAQRTHTAFPGAGVSAVAHDDDTLLTYASLERLRHGAYGYEAVSGVNLVEAWERTAEEALRIASMPARSVDVGRYDVVLGTSMIAEVLADTVGRALELDRARGDKADRAGTSYAMPPVDVLGEYELGSEMLAVTADRSRPGANATVGWDEEGVKPDDFALVKDGTIVDFITTRRTAPTIATWYESRKQPLRSHGCATRSGGDQPILQLPNLTLQPGRAALSAEDLVKDIKRGFYVVNGSGAADQQCLNAQYGGSLAYEIRDGKITGLARDFAFQFSTPQFWKSLVALGGADSAKLEHVGVDSAAVIVSRVGVQAVPARFRQVNIVNTGKQA